MTNDEKAKAYDMALEAARKELGVDRKEWEVVEHVLHNIFPELRESENKKARKKCIELIKRVIPSGDNQSQESKEILDCIAYLEKQKEPTTEELYAEAGTTEKEYIANTMKMVRAMREKKQVQKPISQEDFDTAKHEALWDEQKPAWSEEDTDMLNCCISSIEEAKENRYAYKETDGDTSYDHEIAWLQSLRPSWKPSEDEERLINTSISFLKDFADKGYENAVECIDWLKSKLNGNSC